MPWKKVLLEGDAGGVTVEDTYSFNSGGVAVTTNKVLVDIFNGVGSGKLIKFMQVEAYTRNTGTVAGVSITLEGYRTSDVGTGGSSVTADKMDTLQADLPAQITCRSAPTGGATTSGNAIVAGNIYTEEGVNAQPQVPMYDNEGEGSRERITLREGEGFKVVTGPLGAAGTIAIRIAFSVV